MSRSRVQTLLLAATLGLSVACAPITRNHGYAPSDAELQTVVVGLDTRFSVEDSIGRPTTEGVLTESAWYYLSSKRETFGPMRPRITDRQLVAISFAGDGTVSNVERFTLEDGRVVPLSRRVTDNAVRDTTFLRQLLGNIGRFDAATALGGGGAGGGL